MPRRFVVFVVLAVALAALFVRLGFWQLSRLAERRASNAGLSARLESAPVAITDLLDKPNGFDRRATVTGEPDFEKEFVVTGRSRNGSPGVHIFTPLRVVGRKQLVLVNRGWVYAPDAATIDMSRWRERRRSYSGYTLVLPFTDDAPVSKGRGTRRLTSGSALQLAGDVDGLYLVAQDSGNTDSIPARLPMPALNNGPHLNYAIQWFAFAVIAVVGAVIVARRSRDSALGTRHSAGPR